MAEHSGIIARAAREALAPLGCFQKGRSRTWLDDHGWWVAVIEFQPSSWSKGSFLNVGACWLWYAKDHLSFDDGSRIEGFREFEGTQQFQAVAAALAERAKDEVTALRKRFPSLRATAEHLRTKKTNKDDIWTHYHAGVAAGLAGDVDGAKVRLQDVMTVPEHDLAWVRELKERSVELLQAADDVPLFRDRVRSIVEAARRLLKLPGRGKPIEWPPC
jgi:hypothetical protein